jgi:hypothetical protein
MAVQSITLKLSDDVYERLHELAKTIQRPLEEVLNQTIQGNLPPSLQDLPPELQTEFADFLIMDDRSLWAIAQEPLDAKQWRRHQSLLVKSQHSSLTGRELTELAKLRTLTDHFVLRRSYALAVLKWRGYAVSSPDHLPTN